MKIVYLIFIILGVRLITEEIDFINTTMLFLYVYNLEF